MAVHGGTISINGREYAVGLLWQMGSAAARLDKVARSTATQADADLFCVRSGAVPQFGLGWTEEGHQSGLPAGAVGVADQLSGSAVAMFRVDNGFWYVAIHNDAILPEGDILFQDEDEARERLLRDLDTNQYEMVIAPPEFGIALGEAPKPEELLERLDGPALRMVKPPLRPVLLGGAALVVLCILGGAWYSYSLFQDRLAKERAAALAPLPKLKEVVRPAIIAPPKPLAADQPWKDAPAVDGWLTGCVTAAYGIALTGPGWNLDGVECSGTSAQAKWSRRGGTVSWMTEWAKDNLPGGKVSIAGDGRLASASEKIATRNRVQPEQPRDLWTKSRIENEMWRIFQEHGHEVSMRYSPGVLPPPEKAAEEKPVPPQIEFNFVSEVEPSIWGPSLARIPGLVIKSVQNQGLKQWRVSGVIYEASNVYEIGTNG